MHVSIILLLLNGGKKKKKKRKIPSTPKKNKHTKKKNRLNILKLFMLSKQQIRIAKSCQNNKCSIVNFLANHKNRLSCGRCGYSELKKNEVAE